MNQSTDKNGQLLLGGIPAKQLASEFGTPLYVMDEQKIRQSMRCYTAALRDGYEGRGLICYASKAFSCKEIYRIASSEGLGADIVSGGELYTASEAGFDMKNVCLHGNNKSREELIQAIKCGVGRIVVDNQEELFLLDQIAGELAANKPCCSDALGSTNTGVQGTDCTAHACTANNIHANTDSKPRVLLRIKPGISAHTHDFIRTGQIDSKFGFALETGEAMAAVRAALGMKNIKLVGVHCHIGSQILLAEPFATAAEVMINFMSDIKKQTGVELPELNLGGGFGVVYTEEDSPLDVRACLFEVFDSVRSNCKKHGIKEPFLIFEPGRSLVAESGTTLYTVGSLKTIPNVRTYVSVDGGMCDNMRYILYKARYDMAIADRVSEPKSMLVTVAGRCCESGDLLGENVPIQPAKPGDLLAVFCTGAYNFSMHSTYNRNLRPPVVLTNEGRARLIVRREALSDIVKNDL